MRDERWRAGVGAMVSVGLGSAVLLGGAVLSAGAQSVRPAAGPPVLQGPVQQGPVRVGGNVMAPRKTRHVNPIYPQEAKDARVQGLVILEAQIDRQGQVSDARVLRSIPMLDQAAVDAVRQWEYTVTQLNGQAVPVIMTVTVNFTLDPDRSGATSVGTIEGVSGGLAEPGRGGVVISGSGASSMRWESSGGSMRGAPSLAPALTPAEEAARTPFLIERHRAGVVQRGMSVGDLQHIVPREQMRLVDLANEGNFTPALEIRLEPGAEQPAIVAEFMSIGIVWRLQRLTVFDERFRTADGFGVGTTVGELMDRYPGLRIFHEHGQFATPPQSGLSFRIANDTRNLDAKVRIREARIDAVIVAGMLPSRPPTAR